MRAYGYATYDCIAAGPGPALVEVDLLVASGLNARLSVATLAQLQRVQPYVNQALEAIVAREARGVRPYWELPEAEIVSSVTQDTVGWLLHRCWWLLMSAPSVGPAVTHKVLHHKRPDLFPLLDGKTISALKHRGGQWLAIWQDLTAAPDAWKGLETWFADQAGGDEIPLTRLRPPRHPPMGARDRTEGRLCPPSAGLPERTPQCSCLRPTGRRTVVGRPESPRQEAGPSAQRHGVAS